MESFLNYLRLVQPKVGSEGYEPHPLIMAFVLATNCTNEPDGTYAGMSGDARTTLDKQPRMVFNVSLRKKGDYFEVLDVREMITGRVMTLENIEKIVHSEILIEKFDSRDIPNKQAEAIMADTLGFPVHVMADRAEVEKALKNAQSELKNGNLPDVGWQVTDEILCQKDAVNWSMISSKSRIVVATLWAPKSESRIVVTNLEQSFDKFRLRETIFNLLDFNASS